MTDKKFNAILAKNDIAREVRNYQNDNERYVSVDMIRNALRDIEKYIGEANQPKIDDIISCDEFRL